MANDLYVIRDLAKAVTMRRRELLAVTQPYEDRLDAAWTQLQEAVEAYTGELVGEHFFDGLHPEDGDFAGDVIQQAAEGISICRW